MSMTTDYLLDLVKGRPARHIEKNGAPYLSRYFMDKTADGRQLWLHRFHSSDGDDMLHNHAWSARSWVVFGAYSEEHVTERGVEVRKRSAPPAPVDQTMLYDKVRRAAHGSRWLDLASIPGGEPVNPDTWHRIEWIAPETWTLLVVDPGRASDWYFADPQGCAGVPVRMHDEVAMPEGWALRWVPTEGEDWYKKYCPCDGVGCQICAG